MTKVNENANGVNKFLTKGSLMIGFIIGVSSLFTLVAGKLVLEPRLTATEIRQLKEEDSRIKENVHTLENHHNSDLSRVDECLKSKADEKLLDIRLQSMDDKLERSMKLLEYIASGKLKVGK